MVRDMVEPLSSGGERNEGRRIPIAAIGGVGIVAAVVVGMVLFSLREKPPDPRAMPPEALAYASRLTFSDLHLSAEENFLRQQVVYLDGKVANSGDKLVGQIKVRLYFRDLMNQVVLREDHDVFGGTQGVPPGQTRAFQIRFDAVPESWNQAVPEVQIVSLRAGGP